MDSDGAFISRRGPGEGVVEETSPSIRFLHTSPSFPSGFCTNCQTSDPAPQSFSKNRLRAGDGVNVVAEENTATVGAPDGVPVQGDVAATRQPL